MPQFVTQRTMLPIRRSLGSGTDERVREVLRYLSRHYVEEIRIDALASMVYLSSSRLSHLFKEQVGRTMIEELVRIRLGKAAELLRSTTMQVMDIAFEVGFNSLSFFTRKFSAHYGMSPKKYRQSMNRMNQTGGIFQ